ncbi:hypothetical protein [Paenibacillus terricola]|nr:hypothetical protein [Paenibacillus terricola]
MDTALMTTAKGTLDSSQMKKFTTLSTAFDTKLDQINDEII